jgi:putative membrane protein
MSVKHLLMGAAALALMAQPTLAQDTQPPREAGQAQLADVDLDFATEAAQGGLMEVRLGELAQLKAKSSAVQDFGRRMVEDHGKANEALMQIAARKGIELPQDLSDDGQDTMDELLETEGAEFDQDYMDDMVSDHEDDVAAFESYVEDAEDADLRGFAEATLPTLRDHLELAKRTQEQLGDEVQTAMATDAETGEAEDNGWVSVEEVLGSSVVNEQGDEVGEIQDLVVKDNAYYAVLAVGGFLGLGEKDVAIPLDQLKLGEDESYLMSKQTEDELEQIPAYEQAQYQPAPR